MSIAVIILTLNEELHLARALDSIKGLADEVFVIDSGSTDATLRIAQDSGAHVLSHPFINPARQFQWALDHAPITADWVLRLDADEVVEADLAAEIETRLGDLPPDVTGVVFKRKQVFMGRWIRYGGRYPLMLLRLWRRGAGRIEDRWMDEHVILDHGRTVVFNGGFSDINLTSLHDFMAKHRRYATLEALEVVHSRIGLFERVERAPASDQAAHKRRLKDGVYNRLPVGVGPVVYFLYRYLWRLGFLDGREGAIYHALQGLWYRLLVDRERWRMQRVIKGVTDRNVRLERVRRLTGLPLPP